MAISFGKGSESRMVVGLKFYPVLGFAVSLG